MVTEEEIRKSIAEDAQEELKAIRDPMLSGLFLMDDFDAARCTALLIMEAARQCYERLTKTQQQMEFTDDTAAM